MTFLTDAKRGPEQLRADGVLVAVHDLYFEVP
jgi:hypothetical protein